MGVRRFLGLLTATALLPLGLPAGAHAAGLPGAPTALREHLPNDWLADLSISADGRFVAFTSQADNLVPGDTNGVADAFVRDVKTKQTILLSATATGVPGWGSSSAPSISNNGRYVAFLSRAKNLVAGTPAVDSALFVRDVVKGTTTPVALPAVLSMWTIGPPAISGDGRFVTYAVRGTFSTAFAFLDAQVFRTELATGRVSLVSATSAGVMGDDGSQDPAISDDGNLIVFASAAPNLSSSPYYNAFIIYLKNMTSGAVRQVGSSPYEGSPSGSFPVRSAISGRGGDVAYERLADYYDWLSTVFRGPIIATDLIRGGEREAGLSADLQVSGTALHPSLSEHGIDLVYDSDSPDLVADDPDGTERDVFLTGLRPGGITTLVAANAESPAISDSGRYVAYATYGVSSIHIWRRDLPRGTTLQVDVT